MSGKLATKLPRLLLLNRFRWEVSAGILHYQCGRSSGSVQCALSLQLCLSTQIPRPTVIISQSQKYAVEQLQKMAYLNRELYHEHMIQHVNYDMALENFTQENLTDHNFSGAEWDRLAVESFFLV